MRRDEVPGDQLPGSSESRSPSDVPSHPAQAEHEAGKDSPQQQSAREHGKSPWIPTSAFGDLPGYPLVPPGTIVTTLESLQMPQNTTRQRWKWFRLKDDHFPILRTKVIALIPVDEGKEGDEGEDATPDLIAYLCLAGRHLVPFEQISVYTPDGQGCCPDPAHGQQVLRRMRVLEVMEGGR